MLIDTNLQEKFFLQFCVELCWAFEGVKVVGEADSCVDDRLADGLNELVLRCGRCCTCNFFLMDDNLLWLLSDGLTPFSLAVLPEKFLRYILKFNVTLPMSLNKNFT